MTTYIDPYDEGRGYAPSSTGITRGHSMTDLQEAAASVGRNRRSKEWRYGDGNLYDPNVEWDDMVDRGNVPYERENLPQYTGSPYTGETSTLPSREQPVIYQPYGAQTQYQVDQTPYAPTRPQPQGNNPFIPTQRQQQPPSHQGYPPMRPPMEMPNTASAAPSQYGGPAPSTWHAGVRNDLETSAVASGISSAQQRPPMSLADTFSPAAIAAQRAQREAENKPGANAIFKPQPVTGGRPENIADNVARDVIARAAIAQATGDPNAEALLDQAATYAWQREASINGNERGDISAPRDYIESWKGQVRAGGEGSPFADMFNRASAAARQSLAAEEAARGAQLRAQAPSTFATAGSEMSRLTRTQGGEYGTTRGPVTGNETYNTARGGASNEGQYGTRRLNSSVAEQQYDEELITRVMNGVRNRPVAGAPVASGPMPTYLQGRQPRAGLTSGKDDPGDQAAQVWSSARALGGEEFADAVGGLIVAEGGLTGATGDTHLDPRGSHGPFQFYAKGELQPFRKAMSKKYGREISEQEAMQLARNVDEVTAYYLPKLYGAYQDAKRKGFTGDDLTVGLAAGAFDESGAGHNRGITSDPNQFYPIYRNGLKNFRNGTFAQSGSIASLANQGR